MFGPELPRTTVDHLDSLRECKEQEGPSSKAQGEGLGSVSSVP